MLDRMFLGAAADDKLFVEDVFSTWLYTGNGSTQIITNGIDLSGKGGLVWIKNRSTGADHLLYDTSRGVNLRLATNTTNGTNFEVNQLNSFNSNGFTLGNDGALNAPNRNAENYASWTFREAPKFFDVVTWNGNDAYGRTISHNLGVAPGCIIIKHTSGPYASGNNWVVWHRSDPANVLALNTTGAAESGSNKVLAAGVTATSFQLGGDSTVNRGDGTYVAYLFAHDVTADGIIQCGSYTGNGSATGPSVTLDWEPQWVLVKNATTGYDWWMLDNMRGFTAPSANDAYLVPNSSQAEAATQDIMSPTATGFQLSTSGPMFNRSGDTFIYIAIRRGPMRTPTLGTSVFAPVARTATGAIATVNGVGFPPDLVISKSRNVGYLGGSRDRLRGPFALLIPNSTDVEFSDNLGITAFNMNGFSVAGDSNYGTINFNGSYINYAFRRASGFMDVVCYTGTSVARTVNHNLGVAPELMIVKLRNTLGLNWQVYHKDLGPTKYMILNNSDAPYTSTARWNDTAPTSSVFTVGSVGETNFGGGALVAYLFASAAGVSKVGSYTGNGSSQTINCGFAAGARFVMIKRTDSTGDWYVWDTARGIVAGNDPHLSLNTTATEVTSNDTIDTDSSGFVVNQVAATNVNVNAATYIYLAIA